VTKLRTARDGAGTGVIFRALANNKGLKELELHSYSSRIDNENWTVLCESLKVHPTLTSLGLHGQPINDENWAVLCESLEAHPTLTSLDLYGTRPLWRNTGRSRIVLEDDQKTHRTRLLAEMVQQNTVLHTIEQNTTYETDNQIYKQDISPRLEMNLYRPRVLAISKADISLRRALLGLALQTESVRNESNLLWMFLSGNADVVLSSYEDSEQS
jgi:hypothetical protein